MITSIALATHYQPPHKAVTVNVQAKVDKGAEIKAICWIAL